MKNTFIFRVLCGVAGLTFAVAGVISPFTVEAKETSRKIVIFNDEIAFSAEKDKILGKYNVRSRKHLGLANAAVIEATEDTLRKLSREKSIKRIDDDARAHIVGKVSDTVGNGSGSESPLNAQGSVSLISRGATWKYLDNGSNQAGVWRPLSFNDGTWKSGPAELGYGDGDEATVVSFGPKSSYKYVTTYFRRSFDVADRSQITGLTLKLLRDDGAVVYLNGTEVFRSNMPSGSIGYTTLASKSNTSSTSYYSKTILPSLLQNGENVIAVEVHQASRKSSDVSFNLELIAATASPVTPPLAPSNLSAGAFSESQINLSWMDNSNNESGFKIERSDDGVSFGQIATVATGVISFSDTGRSVGTEYFYKVRATNSAGDSSYSNTASATTLAPPPPPTGDLYECTIITYYLEYGSTDAETEGQVTKLQKFLQAEGSYPADDTIGGTFGSVTEQAVKTFQSKHGINPGGTVGPLTQAKIKELSCDEVATPPAAPTNLSAATVSSTAIDLTWTDTSGNESGFTVYRSTDNINYVIAATVAANAVTYPDSNLLPSVTYSYKVQAFNEAGTSGYSNIASTTTYSEVTPWGIISTKANLVWPTANGAGIRIGVIDSGIDTLHPDLLVNIRGGFSAVSYTSSYNDDNGHGTHVAGTIAAVRNTVGVVGVAPNAELYSIKVLDKTGSGWISDIIEGIDWAIANNIQVVNLSLGTASDIQVFHEAIIRAKNAGVVVVAAAGNNGGPVIYPAAYPEAIAVSAIDSSNIIASWSSRGSEVDLAAPGVSVESTFLNGSYAILSGTSMAAPHVSGAVALLLGLAPGAYDTDSDGRWDPGEVQQKLEARANDVGSVGKDILYGAGIVDALAAIQP